ncbi:hypothetical protein LTR10_009642 [Elasticomyces elasticus]|nr:hypothetical protein LTR10_009642 [Elasticomyces elasticus]KAK4969934.1 hypothetical protein LTR42_008100 [Elasticomyces elasticus]
MTGAGRLEEEGAATAEKLSALLAWMAATSPECTNGNTTLYSPFTMKADSEMPGSTEQSPASPATAPVTSYHHMFDVSELLERVLLYLPLRDILLSQRVCHLWQESFNQSPKIQRVLFLKATSTLTVMNHRIWHEEQSQVDSHWCKLPTEDAEMYVEADGHCEGAVEPIANPLAYKYLQQGYYPFYGYHDFEFPFTRDILLGQIGRSASDASLGNMFLTNPPIRDAHIFWPQFMETGHCIVLRNEAGLTAKDMLTQLEDHTSTCTTCLEEIRTKKSKKRGYRYRVHEVEDLNWAYQPLYECDGWTMLEVLKRNLDSDRQILYWPSFDFCELPGGRGKRHQGWVDQAAAEETQQHSRTGRSI